MSPETPGSSVSILPQRRRRWRTVGPQGCKAFKDGFRCFESRVSWVGRPGSVWGREGQSEWRWRQRPGWCCVDGMLEGSEHARPWGQLGRLHPQPLYGQKTSLCSHGLHPSRTTAKIFYLIGHRVFIFFLIHFITPFVSQGLPISLFSVLISRMSVMP